MSPDTPSPVSPGEREKIPDLKETIRDAIAGTEFKLLEDAQREEPIPLEAPELEFELRPDSVQGSAGAPGANWKWTNAKELAAKLLAEGDLTDEKIAEQAKVSVRGLYKWKLVPEFQDRVREYMAAYRERVLSTKYARREKRIEVREKLIDGLLQIKEERGSHQTMEKVPGGKSGLIILQPRAVGSGENQKIHIEAAVDTSLIDKIEGGLREIAKETGQWTEKHEVGGMSDVDGNPTGAPIQLVVTAAESEA